MRRQVVAVVVGATSFAMACRKDEPRATGASSATPARHDDAERRQRIDAEVSADTRLTAAKCTHAAPQPPGALGQISLSDDDDARTHPGEATISYLPAYLRTIGSGVDIVAPLAAHAPLGRREGFAGATATLVIDAWTDPVIGAGASTFRSGELVGRMLLWDPAAHDIVCGARVKVGNNPKLTLVETMGPGAANSAEDPLSKARVDLVGEAVSAGLSSLVEVAR